ncbi:Sugar transferase, PEP-CTERM/EpsH1 system associated [Petrocella atlantisensis]|uniref:Sugar transferase, PEP-CTERM/EpsH1 system associated n=1 Tax=Petrocella atlantisensis TaxID=2173034 RepID=A0A3P7PNV8_9FIRM|nr:glycosyltransferase [Petrocella atlantisensis]VDN46177.1 Sugar transferase, PEP-CTERM/EpsH1 system associated [Petrocella atlantisensis]
MTNVKDVVYLGAFPPPYGGVTIKNSMLYMELSKHKNVYIIELSKVKKINLHEIFKFLTALFFQKKIFIVGASGSWRKKITYLLYFFNRKSLKNSILIVMGGTSAKNISKDATYLKMVSNYKKVYVEADGMKNELVKVGLSNVSIFPNCRNEKNTKVKINYPDQNKMKCVYFSLISKEKGADIIFETVKILAKKNIQFEVDFFGAIEKSYQEEFEQQTSLYNNINYCGIFKTDIADVYTKLNEYDLLLFPTRWKNEGVPGVLVESKIAALPAIVSDINFNAEIIHNGIDGIVLKHNNPAEMAVAIERLYNDKDYLFKLKKNAYESRSKYLLENYIDEIVNELVYQS